MTHREKRTWERQEKILMQSRECNYAGMELSWRQRGLVVRPLWFPAACSLFIITERVILHCLVMSGYIFLDVNYNAACLTSVSSSPENCNWFSHCYYGMHCYPEESFSLHLPSPMPSLAPEKAESFHYCVAEKVLRVKAAKSAPYDEGNRCLRIPVIGAWTELVSRKKRRNLLHFFHCSCLLWKALRQDFIARSQQVCLGYLAQGLKQNDPLWLHKAAFPPCPSQASVSRGDTQTWGWVTQGSQM